MTKGAGGVTWFRDGWQAGRTGARGHAVGMIPQDQVDGKDWGAGSEGWAQLRGTDSGAYRRGAEDAEGDFGPEKPERNTDGHGHWNKPRTDTDGGPEHGPAETDPGEDSWLLLRSYQRFSIVANTARLSP